MDQQNDAMEMLGLLPCPAFCVRKGVVTNVNRGALSLMIESGMSVKSLLETGAEEYDALSDGCLYLNLNISGESVGASVCRMGSYDVFRLESGADDRELQAMALAARALREPLAAIMNTAEQFLPKNQSDKGEAANPHMERLNRSLYQMLRIISNMSDAGNYISRANCPGEVRDITAVIGDVFTKSAELLTKAGVTLNYAGIEHAVYGLVNAQWLERAILNILSNAIKFSGEGSRIDAKLTQKGNKLYLSIQDSGPGIQHNIKPNIFNCYTRTPTLEEGRYGIGLGMVLVRAAAASHGGTVLIDQPEGTGTRVTMSIAIRQAPNPSVRSGRLQVDYSGERDHSLLELSDCLPAFLYENE